ncbi:hypothetical protein JYU10_00400 [bacterium AH-315-J04]|nr:hypothetical protein [bacterium AH-315-J04]
MFLDVVTATRYRCTIIAKLLVCAGVSLLTITSTISAQVTSPKAIDSVIDAIGEREMPNGAAPEISISDRGLVNLHVAEVDLSTVLTLLSVQSQRNIIASPNVSGKVTAHLYGVSFDDALRAVLIPNGADFQKSGSFIYVYTQDELAKFASESAAKPITKIFRLNYTSSRDATTYVRPLLSENGKIVASSGGANTSSGSSPGGNSGGSSSRSGGSSRSASQDFVIVTDSPAIIETVENVIKTIDVRPQQVLIESTILRAQLNDNNSLGIDFSLVGGVDLNLLGATSLSVPDITVSTLPQDRFERFNAAARTDFSSDVPNGGLSIGILKDKVSIFLRALELVTDTTVLANPKILALNKQQGQVIVGRRDGFLTTTVTASSAVQSVEFLETGTQLIFRPFIADDGYIRVELHPEDSVGFVNAQGLPSEQTTEVTTTVIVRDGDTILIGGLFREVVADTRNQIPFMGNIPGLGSLFRSTNDTTTREEVIILLTIHIVKNHAEYAESSLEMKENIDRLRVGMRRGLMWHGRDKLAQTHYHKATDLYNSGDLEQAQWHLDLALHNSSRMLPAIKLKERILKQREWGTDSTSIRSFIYHLIENQKDHPQPPYGQPVLRPIESFPVEPVDQTGDNNEMP